ncbi:glycosyltransferase family 1 protein [Paenibacillus sp. HB172176]|uniref:glycosyltransferase family 4 protein n=1 Tax=Paenibacillus sp. HB172176 TaxID=2493690 RepID=UPI00143C3860|nr:glycosyltransferase family 1 protein [Paenibacillus sp. HB172176]
MRVAIFTDTYAPEVNGVARTLGRWTDYLQSQGIACKVFAPEPATSGQRTPQASPVERFASLPFFLYPECRLALPRLGHIRTELQLFKPDFIHVATPFNLGLCGIHYARKYQIPLIASYHTNFDHYLSFYNLQWMEKLLWRYMEWFHRDCRAIFVPSRNTFSDLALRGWDIERLGIWSRGVDSTIFHPLVNRKEQLEQHGLGNCPFLVSYAGRLAPEKNVETALDAFRRFQQSTCSEAVLIIAGDGPSAPALKEKCRREGIDARFVGFASPQQLQRWYAASDVMLFPSPTETFGNVVLEAMACGTAVICADRGGVLDTVKDGWNGYLCKTGNAESFSAALEDAYKHPAKLLELGRNAHSHSLEQSWSRIFEELLAACVRSCQPSGWRKSHTDMRQIK